VYRAREARRRELLADVHAQRVAQSFAVGVGQLAERPRDELAGALLVGEGEGDQLDVGEPRDPAGRAAGTSAARWRPRRSGSPEPVDPAPAGPAATRTAGQSAVAAAIAAAPVSAAAASQAHTEESWRSRQHLPGRGSPAEGLGRGASAAWTLSSSLSAR